MVKVTRQLLIDRQLFIFELIKNPWPLHYIFNWNSHGSSVLPLWSTFFLNALDFPHLKGIFHSKQRSMIPPFPFQVGSIPGKSILTFWKAISIELWKENWKCWWWVQMKKNQYVIWAWKNLSGGVHLINSEKVGEKRWIACTRPYMNHVSILPEKHSL